MNDQKQEPKVGLSLPRLAALAFCAGVGMLVMAFFAGYTAKADPAVPNPGCGFVSDNPYSPCAQPPPVPGEFWTPIDGVPGTVGPHGYTPCTYRDPCLPTNTFPDYGPVRR